jgi:hypothetical protein
MVTKDWRGAGGHLTSTGALELSMMPTVLVWAICPSAERSSSLGPVLMDRTTVAEEELLG